VLNLTFTPLKARQGRIDVTSARVADNGTQEFDIASELCGEEIVNISEFTDINRNGVFTLLDLGIDAWYYGQPASSTDSTRFDADIVADGTIDNTDLTAIVQAILANGSYPPNQG
jgi:hypothetical protein